VAADAPADGPDILIATAGLLFWLPRKDWTATRGRDIPPLWWFAAAYYLFLRQDTSTDQAARWLAWLGRIAVGYQAIPQGWDPSWSAIEGGAQLALAHIRMRAAHLAQGCHRRALPRLSVLVRLGEGRVEAPSSPYGIPGGFRPCLGTSPA
jgi:hypothetical protein